MQKTLKRKVFFGPALSRCQIQGAVPAFLCFFWINSWSFLGLRWLGPTVWHISPLPKHLLHPEEWMVFSSHFSGWGMDNHSTLQCMGWNQIPSFSLLKPRAAEKAKVIATLLICLPIFAPTFHWPVEGPQAYLSPNHGWAVRRCQQLLPFQSLHKWQHSADRWKGCLDGRSNILHG